MKYVQLASLSTPSSVSTWLQDELVNRGVDAAYTFYVLSLLREPEVASEEQEEEEANCVSVSTLERRRRRAKRCAVECLKSAADSNEGFDTLVEELLTRLEPPPEEEGEEDQEQG